MRHEGRAIDAEVASHLVEIPDLTIDHEPRGVGRQLGAGRSELPADTSRLVVDRQIRDLDEVRRYFGVDRATLVAHSYGPLLAASYALASPTHVRRMVFFGPVPPRRGNFWQRLAANV